LHVLVSEYGGPEACSWAHEPFCKLCRVQCKYVYMVFLFV
jgi:hypothetical protein